MLLAATAKGFPAVLVVVGVLVGIYGMWMFATGKPSETGSKFIAGGIGVMALGIILAQF
ncbi:MAG: hypothetical protein JWO68_447 [Actinomycetia bacterium]|nr:hypothetical protein [Actinomycetes bacterium]